METQTTITIDPTNSLAAMAFVLADQQRVIKRLQEEAEVFRKESKEMIELGQQNYDALDSQYSDLQEQYYKDIADLNKRIERIPSWRPCRSETAPNGDHYLTGFDHDGPVMLMFYIREGSSNFWDCFNLQHKEGDIAYAGVIVEHDIVDNTFYAVDFGKEVKYLPLRDFVSYSDTPDTNPE